MGGQPPPPPHTHTHSPPPLWLRAHDVTTAPGFPVRGDHLFSRVTLSLQTSSRGRDDGGMGVLTTACRALTRGGVLRGLAARYWTLPNISSTGLNWWASLEKTKKKHTMAMRCRVFFSFFFWLDSRRFGLEDVRLRSKYSSDARGLWWKHRFTLDQFVPLPPPPPHMPLETANGAAAGTRFKSSWLYLRSTVGRSNVVCDEAFRWRWAAERGELSGIRHWRIHDTDVWAQPESAGRGELHPDESLPPGDSYNT